ncbi:hypothetical protein BZA70DRAFT_265829 [Myxozyma melibiosi]|uniref:Uncharacterized protein n=1 Tax=Myxozyma melibiosi TaxID=54550 RepID=A0ABR1FFC6_9ASCO
MGSGPNCPDLPTHQQLLSLMSRISIQVPLPPLYQIRLISLERRRLDSLNFNARTRGLTVRAIGYNKYYPPDYDGKSSLNKLAGKHSLGDRARKIKQGILIVRFELPFDIVCLRCENYLAQGTRFNAEKKKVGAYYTTPIFSFRFKCQKCRPTSVHGQAHYVEIETDPANTEYKVVEGARRSNNDGSGYDQAANDGSENDAKTEIEETDDVFAKVEKQAAETLQRRRASKRIQELYEDSTRRWGDPYTKNQELRRIFRGKKKETEKQNKASDSLAWRVAKVSQHRKQITSGSTTASSGEKKSAKQLLMEAVTKNKKK